MQGRVLGIKKTYLLRATALICFVAFVALCVLSATIFKKADLWFYSFCLCLGTFELVKSMLFKLDSSFYLGTLLFGIGAVGYIFLFTNTRIYAPFYICLAFIVASVLTAVFCGQRFHLIIAYSIFFVALYALMLIKNFITTPIFIAFIVPFLVLFILGVILGIKRRR